jgi:hypothetical protein
LTAHLLIRDIAGSDSSGLSRLHSLLNPTPAAWKRVGVSVLGGFVGVADAFFGVVAQDGTQDVLLPAVRIVESLRDVVPSVFEKTLGYVA